MAFSLVGLSKLLPVGGGNYACPPCRLGPAARLQLGQGGSQVKHTPRTGRVYFREQQAPDANTQAACHEDTAGSSTTSPSLDAQKAAVVVGAGPAGALAAVYLAREGYSVQVYEARALPDPVHRNLDRSYHLAVSHRGLAALEGAGVDMSRFRAFPYRGSMLTTRDGRVNRVFHTPVTAKVLVERMELVRHLVDESRRLWPGRITYHFGHRCEGVDPDKQQVHFQKEGGQPVSVHYDMLVGADGVNSKVRQELEGKVPGFSTWTEGKMHRIDKFFHRVTTAGPSPFQDGEDDGAQVLRFFHVDSPPPLSVGLFFIQNQPDGSFSGGISFSRADMSEEGSGGNLRSGQDWLAVLAQLTQLPQDMQRQIAEQLAARPWYASGTTLQVSSLAVPGCVLLGDAAHAVSAAFGQGVNSALEDCGVLGRALQEAQRQGRPDVDSVLQRYSRTRLPDVRALSAMDSKAEAFLGYKGRGNLAYWTWQGHQALQGALHRLAPARFGPPGIVEMLLEPLSYGQIYRRVQRNAAVVAAAALAALALVARLALRMASVLA